jgi:hypothetical protein
MKPIRLTLSVNFHLPLTPKWIILTIVKLVENKAKYFFIPRTSSNPVDAVVPKTMDFSHAHKK